MYIFLPCSIAFLLTPLVLSLNVTAPAPGELIDITKPYEAKWIPTAYANFSNKANINSDTNVYSPFQLGPIHPQH